MTQSAVRTDDLDLPEVDLSGDAYLSDPVAVLQRRRQTSWLIRTRRPFAIQVLSHEVAAQMIRDPRLNGPGPDMYQGTPIGINTLATNTDPEVSGSAETFGITRSNASKQLIFAGGARLRLGHALARAEMTEALQIFAARFPDMDLGGEVEFTPSPTLLGPERLPLRLRSNGRRVAGHSGSRPKARHSGISATHEFNI